MPNEISCVRSNTVTTEQIMKKYPPITKSNNKKIRKRKIPHDYFSEQKARKQWIDNLQEQQVTNFLNSENITLEQLKERLYKNNDYDIGDYWEKNCNPKYGHLNENARTKKFIEEMEFFMIPLPENGYSQKERQMFKRIREKADSVKAIYTDYVAALLKCFGEKQMSYSRLNFKKGPEVYLKWLKNGKRYPDPKPLIELVKRVRYGRMKDENR